MLEKLKAGARIALVSDAGTPLVSDRGIQTGARGLSGRHRGSCRARRQRGADRPCFVRPAIRPLSVRRLPAAAKAGERRAALEELKALRATLIVFESAQRLDETLAEMNAVLGPRDAVVAREMTKLHEEVRRAIWRRWRRIMPPPVHPRAKSPCWWVRRERRRPISARSTPPSGRRWPLCP